MPGMSAERWHAIDAVVDRALDLAPALRAAFVARTCAGDDALREDVERLLHSCEVSEDYLAQPAAEFAAPLVAAQPLEPGVIGMRVGPYRIVAEAGHGGMGAVYLADRDDAQFHHRVALKLVRRGRDRDERVVRRFMEERQILATLEHPHIARLLDGGVTADGLPYFAMEYVQGTPIDRYCDDHRLSVEQRLALFCTVCDAVQYAHHRLVVHQDLKPANILVTGNGDVKLLDFGIASLLASDTSPPRGASAHGGARLMTLAYASPEQMSGDAITTSSDVYSLGVLLHELLVGRRPPRAVLDTGETHDRADSIESMPPSARLTKDADAATIALARNSSPVRLQRRVHGDLDAIVQLAIQPAAQRRYPSAERLASDIRRHLTQLPVSARGDSWRYRAGTFVRRHRLSVAAGTAFVLMLAASTISTRMQSARLTRERDKAEAVSALLASLFATSNPYANLGGGTLTARTLLDSGAARVGRDLRSQPDVRAQMMATIGRAYYGLGLFDHARRMIESSTVLRREALGEDHPDVLQSLNFLALVRLDAGEPVAAESLYRQVLAGRRRLYGPHHPAVARTLNGLGLALLIQGRPEAAEPPVREALAIDRASAGDPLELGQSLNNLGRVLMDRGDYDAAEDAFREAVAMRRARLDEGAPEVDNAVSNLAGALWRRGEIGEASRLLEGVVRRKRLTLGSEHPDLASDVARYAEVLHASGRWAEAETLFVEALAVHRRAHPRGHTATARTLVGFSRLRLDSGDTAVAVALLREAIDIERRTLPPTHPRIVEAERLLANASPPSSQGVGRRPAQR